MMVATSSFIGGALMFLPYLLLTMINDHFDNIPELLFLTFKFLLPLTSAALAAAILGLTIKPYIIFATSFLIANIIISMIQKIFFPAETSNAPNNEKTISPQQQTDHKLDSHAVFWTDHSSSPPPSAHGQQCF